MERNLYGEIVLDTPDFFVGEEIEATHHVGKPTLFVVGLQDINEIIAHAKDHFAEHIYLGANRSFSLDADCSSAAGMAVWDTLAWSLAKLDFSVTLDMPIDKAHLVHHDLQIATCKDICLIFYCHFDPMLHNDNSTLPAYVRFDTYSFDDSDDNNGPRVVPCQDLLKGRYFTPWSAYKNDKPC